jgi:DNA polymerase-3 subunit epsilon/ATP-dependent DNA helicase DinG
MKQSLLAFDLETTGLDPERDSIIEIGAVRFRGSRVEDEWTTLVNPGRPLDPVIKALTGITDEMLANAPRLTQVIQDFQHFAGDLIVLGHNIRFDLSFLQPKGILRDNISLDTYTLASVLLPSAGRYSLAGLASALAVPVMTSHRALEDAHTTRQLFLRLYDQALGLPPDALEEICRLGAEIEWDAGWVFDKVFEETRRTKDPTDRQDTERSRFFKPASIDIQPLSPVEHPQPINSDDIAAILEPGGVFDKRFPAYEHRPQQITMLRAVCDALSNSRHLLVEAGTGIGKSMAYLIPSLAWAAQNQERVIISTNTINLQEQLIHKDVPDLSETLQADYRAAILKGRSNYICPRRLASLRQIGPRTREEMRMLAKILVWLYNGGSGDRSEINLSSRESAAWSRLSAEGEDCSVDGCLEYADGVCPYYQVHRQAENAHVVIVNHALLLADIATGNRVIPDYRYLIVDEAHHLESATTNGLSFQVSQNAVGFILRDLGSVKDGLLHQIIELARKELPADLIKTIEQIIDTISDKRLDCSELTQRLFNTLSDFMAQQRDGKPIGPYGQRARIVPATRTLPKWSEVEIAWEDARGPLSAITNSLSTLSESLEDMSTTGIEIAQNLATAVRISTRSLMEIMTNLENMIFEPDPQTIYWLQSKIGEGDLYLHAAPLTVGPLIERFLWHEKEAVIMTSATLTIGGEFDYLKQRLSAEDADELALGSPFDFETSTLLYLINDIPEPADRQAYQRAVENTIIRLCQATLGKTLVLFTSNLQLSRTARAIAPYLVQAGVDVLEQTSGASRHALLERFRSSEQAVLLGTRSFWEGVDVPGEALSVLGITRLPFDVPNDPIIAARAETYESPFDEFTLPEAVLRFRQGFGRLIRTQSDRGVVFVLDRRILSKKYGSAFIDSLPRCTLRSGSMEELPEAASRWLGI